jgi:hypothetical protein
MNRTVLATVAAVALITGAVSVQAGENDLGLKASGNAAGPGGDVKGRAETTGSGIATDSRASANPRSNNLDTGRVDTPAGTTIKPPTANGPQ